MAKLEIQITFFDDVSGADRCDKSSLSPESLIAFDILPDYLVSQFGFHSVVSLALLVFDL